MSSLLDADLGHEVHTKITFLERSVNKVFCAVFAGSPPISDKDIGRVQAK